MTKAQIVMDRHFLSRSASISICVFLIWMLSSCGPAETPTPFIPPAVTPSPTAFTPTLALIVPTSTQLIPTATLEPTVTPKPELDCFDNLLFIDDLTIPDGLFVQPGQVVDKQWLVKNNGTCDWGANYRLWLVGGEALGAASEQALYPAKAGSEATLRILFTAPLEPGYYVSSWQAYSPDNIPFGDALYLKITVGG